MKPRKREWSSKFSLVDFCFSFVLRVGIFPRKDDTLILREGLLVFTLTGEDCLS